jgi:hypothetical protein
VAHLGDHQQTARRHGYRSLAAGHQHLPARWANTSTVKRSISPGRLKSATSTRGRVVANEASLVIGGVRRGGSRSTARTGPGSTQGDRLYGFNARTSTGCCSPPTRAGPCCTSPRGRAGAHTIDVPAWRPTAGQPRRHGPRARSCRVGPIPAPVRRATCPAPPCGCPKSGAYLLTWRFVLERATA